MIQLTGTIQEIGETKSYPKKDGTGNIDITKLKINEKYFTSFDKKQLEGLPLGSVVDVTYTEKINDFEGKSYTNNNISILKLHSEELTKETQKKIEAIKQVMNATGTNATDPNFSKNVQNVLKGENIINVGEKTYKVTLEEIN